MYKRENGWELEAALPNAQVVVLASRMTLSPLPRRINFQISTWGPLRPSKVFQLDELLDFNSEELLEPH